MSEHATVLPLFQGMLDHESEPVSNILNAAEACFQGKGYHGTSIREIADVANVSKSVLHYYFQSKEHLFLEVQIHVFNRISSSVTEAIADLDTTTERGLCALDTLFDALRESGDLAVQAELWARTLTNARAGAHAMQLREYLRDIVVATLDKILGGAWDVAPFDKEVAADLLLAILMGLGIHGGNEPNERVEAAFLGIRNLVELALQTTEAESEANLAGKDQSDSRRSDES